MKWRRVRAFVALSLVLILSVGCGDETMTLPVAKAARTPAVTTPTPGSSSPTPTWTLRPSETPSATATNASSPTGVSPTAQPTMTDSPTSTPEPTPTWAGRLLRLRTTIDLSLPGGNLYRPHAAALDVQSGHVFVVGQATLKGQGYILGRVEAGADSLTNTRPLPGYSSLAVGPGLVFVLSSGEAGTTLLALDGEDLSEVARVSLSDEYASSAPMVADPGGQYLFLASRNRLEMRDAQSLTLLDQASRDLYGVNPALALAPETGTVYLGSEGTLEAFRSTSSDQLQSLWLQTPPYRIEDLVVDGVEGDLYAATSRWEGDTLVKGLFIHDAAWGDQVGTVWDESAEQRRVELLAAQAGRLYLSSVQGNQAYVAILDENGAELARYEHARAYGVTMLADLRRQHLYVVGQQDHLMQRLDSASLDVQGQAILGVEIRGLLPAAGRVYVSDSAARLHILDDADYAVIDRLDGVGNGQPLVLSPAGEQLFVPWAGNRRQIGVVDTDNLALLDILSGGDRVAFDAERGRLFLGYEQPVWPVNEEGPGVLILDQDSLAQVAALSRGGVPAYNPVRDELYVADYSVYVHDGETYAKEGELTPDIGAQPLRSCNGCRIARDVLTHREQDLLIVDITISSAGKGPGLYPPPRFYDLETREPLTRPVRAQLTCGGQWAFMSPTDGVLYETQTYSRYVHYQNLLALEAGTDRLLRWRDGLNAYLVVPEAGVIYVQRDRDHLLALDMETWAPLGTVPYYCVNRYDRAQGRVYASEDGRLFVLDAQGGRPLDVDTWQPIADVQSIRGIYPSPMYATDGVLFIHTDQGLLRTEDGGESWEQLASELAGLGQYAFGQKLVFSPAYDKDRTLFMLVQRSGGVGYGVLRSEDGGESWTRLWQGLQSWHPDELVLSSSFPEDGTVLLYTSYHRLVPNMTTGKSVYISRNRGDNWTLIRSRDQSNYDAPPLPEPAQLVPLDRGAVRMRLEQASTSIQLTTDGGENWQTVLARPEGEWWVDLLLTADWAEGGAAYAVTSHHIYRSLDRGQSWQQAPDVSRPRGTEPPPPWQAAGLARDKEGRSLLFLGDRDGQLVRLIPADLGWAPVAVPVPSPTPTAAYTPTATPVAAVDCDIAPASVFENVAARSADTLGCPVVPPQQGDAATQPFERGRMFWRADQRLIYVLAHDGRWMAVEDKWTPDKPDYDPAITAPEGLMQPVRGFGLVWREVLGEPDEGPADRLDLGWATAPEVGYEATWQSYQGGLLITDDQGRVHLLAEAQRIG